MNTPRVLNSLAALNAITRLGTISLASSPERLSLNVPKTLGSSARQVSVSSQPDLKQLGYRVEVEYKAVSDFISFDDLEKFKDYIKREYPKSHDIFHIYGNGRTWKIVFWTHGA